MKTTFTKPRLLNLPIQKIIAAALAACCVLALSVGLSAQVTVNIFRDYDADGVDDGAGEPGIAGLTVTAYDNAGAASALTDGGNGKNLHSKWLHLLVLPPKNHQRRPYRPSLSIDK